MNKSIWIILGPLCLLGTVSVALFLQPHLEYPLAIFAGILLCYYLRWVGFTVAVMLIGILLYFFPLAGYWLSIGAMLSTILGWGITILALEDFEDNEENELQAHEELIKAKEGDLISQKEMYKKSLETEKIQFDILSQTQLQTYSELTSLKEVLQQKDQSLNVCQNRLTAVLQNYADQKGKVAALLQNHAEQAAKQAELESLGVQKEKEYLEKLQGYELKIKLLAEQIIELKKPQMQPDVKELWQAMRKAEGLYQQLREQFEDKSTLLEDVRRELFHANEALLKQQKDEIEREFYDASGEVENLIKHINKMENEYQSKLALLEIENQAYCQIIDKVIINPYI